MTKPLYSVGQQLVAVCAASGKSFDVTVTKYLGQHQPAGSTPFALSGHCYEVETASGHKAAFKESRLWSREAEAA